MNTEDFVTYEQSLALKKLGFDLDCYACYLSGNFTNNMPCSNYNIAPFKNNCSAPTLAQAQKWLRNEGLFLIVDMGQDRKHDSKFAWYVNNSNGYIVDVLASEIIYNSYEEALSAGITECLELLTNKP